MGQPPALPQRRGVHAAVAWLPVALAVGIGLWPVLLWWIHQSDPERAVRLASGAAALARATLWTIGLGLPLALLLSPASRAFLRWRWQQAVRPLTLDHRPLQRALAEVKQLDPSMAKAWHELGLLCFGERQYRPAAEAFAQAERLEPGHCFGEALLLLGRCLFLLNQPAALSVLAQHRSRHGGGARSGVWLAEVLDASGQAAAATAALQDVVVTGQVATAEEAWFRALARLRLRGRRQSP
jgi:tetratricopeptide (TPR) repeat protein